MKRRSALRFMTALAAVCGVAVAGARAETVRVPEQLKVDVGLARPYMMAGQKDTNYLRVGLTGIPINEPGKRTPVNVAIVLDKSGSMSGDKLRKAKDGAFAAIDRLGPNDIVSVVAYDHTVEVLVPATKVSDRLAIRQAIEKLTANGNTALFAGVSKGAAEVRKFLDRQRVNRIILLSDGQANVGPSSPSDLGSLGASLIKEGISVTTLGLGLDYNENLMAQLALKSDGTHYFIENSTDLASKFGYEINDVLSVVAQEVTIRITCAEGVRPIRMLGRDADITGQTVTTYLNQVNGQQEKYALLEVEAPAGSDGTSRNIADVTVTYVNMASKTAEKFSRTAAVRFSRSASVVESNTNNAVMTSAVEQIGLERNRLAVKLRDQGKIEEARRVLLENAAYLNANNAKLNSKDLADYEKKQQADAASLEGPAWDQRRKEIVVEQNIRAGQNSNGGNSQRSPGFGGGGGFGGR